MSTVRAWIVVALLSLLATATLQARADCPPDAAKAAAIADVQQRLRASPVTEDEALDGRVPPPIQRDLRALKDALVGFADARMACADEKVAAGQLKDGMFGALKGNRPASTSSSDDMAFYGAALTVDVQRPAQWPTWMVVQFTFAIPCGDDNVLLVYEWNNGRWRPVMRWQSPDYGSLAGAFGDGMNYLVVPGDVPRIAVFHGTPWCTSSLSEFDLDLLGKGAKVSEPRVLFHQRSGYRRWDAVPPLKLVSGGFELRVRTLMLDMDIMDKTDVYRYRLDGERVRRVQPAALNGRDFVDEWLQIDWALARSWSDGAALPALERAHRALQQAQEPAGDAEFSYGAVRACTGDAHLYQVELDIKSANRPIDSPRYFQIRSGDNRFTLMKVSAEADARCNSADLMKRR